MAKYETSFPMSMYEKRPETDTFKYPPRRVNPERPPNMPTVAECIEKDGGNALIDEPSDFKPNETITTAKLTAKPPHGGWPAPPETHQSHDALVRRVERLEREIADLRGRIK